MITPPRKEKNNHGRYNTARVTVDLSPAQRAALDEMIARYNTEVGKVLGLELRIGMGNLFAR